MKSHTLANAVGIGVLAFIAGCATAPPPASQPDIAERFATQKPLPAAKSEPKLAGEFDAEAKAAAGRESAAEAGLPALVSGVVFADDPPSFDAAQPLDLPTALAAMFARNPELAAARASVAAIEAEHGQLDALRRVRQQYRAFTAQLDPSVGPQVPPIAGPEAFPLPGPDGLRARIVAISAGIARDKLALAQRKLVRDTRMAFARAAFWQAMGEILTEQRGLATAIREVQRARFESGSIELSGILAIDDRIARLENARDDAARNFASEAATLAKLLALEDAKSIGRVKPHEWPAAPDAAEMADWRAGMAKHPELRMLRHMRERTATMGEMVETMSQPSASFGLSQLPNPLGDSPEFRAMPPMDSPWFGLQAAYRAELAHREAMVAANFRARADALRAEIVIGENALATADAEFVLHAQTLDALAKQAVSATAEAFRTGRASIDRVLGALDQRLQAASGAAMAVRDRAMAWAVLDFLLGAKAAK